MVYKTFGLNFLLFKKKKFWKKKTKFFKKGLIKRNLKEEEKLKEKNKIGK